MGFWEQIRSVRWASAALGCALLFVNTACDSECSESASHGCSDRAHYGDCARGEAMACSGEAPVCLDFAGSSICRSNDESKCLTLDPALRGDGVRADDLDGDGSSDLVFLSEGSVVMASGLPSGGFAPPLKVVEGVDSFELVDLTRDGQADLLLLEQDKLVLVPGTGDATFDTRAARVLLESVKAVLGVVDFDVDGFNDVVVTEAGERLTALPSSADFEPQPLELTAPPSPERVFAADLDGDGTVELLVEGGQKQVGVYQLDVDFWVQTKTLLGKVALLADLNADERLDLVFNLAEPRVVSVQLGQRQGGFEEVASFEGKAFMAGDLNADGNLDLLLNRLNPPTQLQVVRLDGNGDATFTEATPLLLRDNPPRAQTIVSGGETGVVFDGDIGFVSVLSASCLAQP